MHEFRQKIDSICYLATIIRFDITKTANKLAKFLINSRLERLIAANHCIQYMHFTRHLTIKYVVSKNEELNVVVDENDAKQMFETIINASFANEKERRLIEDYIFKLYDELID